MRIESFSNGEQSGYSAGMTIATSPDRICREGGRCRHAELMILCARIGYDP
jgi:hypothetical protein